MTDKYTLPDVPESDAKSAVRTEQIAGKTVQVGAVSPQIPEGMIKAKVYTPFKTYFEGYAYSLSASNDTGTFDILAGHHNFISMLVPCDIQIHTEENIKTIRISRGLVHVRSDIATVFLDV